MHKVRRQSPYSGINTAVSWQCNQSKDGVTCMLVCEDLLLNCLLSMKNSMSHQKMNSTQSTHRFTGVHRMRNNCKADSQVVHARQGWYWTHFLCVAQTAMTTCSFTLHNCAMQHSNLLHFACEFVYSQRLTHRNDVPGPHDIYHISKSLPANWTVSDMDLS